jgi:hypothetical protein
VDWLEVLMSSGWSSDDLFIELMPNGVNLIMDGTIDPMDVDDLVLDILEEVSGRYWWVAIRLIGILMASWDVMGAEATFNHVDPEKLSLAAWLDAMLVLLMRCIKKEDLPMFVAQLEMPPAGEQVPVQDMEISESQFLSMAD